MSAAEKIPFELLALDAAEVGALLGVERRYVLERLAPRPDFPAPVPGARIRAGFFFGLPKFCRGQLSGQGPVGEKPAVYRQTPFVTRKSSIHPRKSWLVAAVPLLAIYKGMLPVG